MSELWTKVWPWIVGGVFPAAAVLDWIFGWSTRAEDMKRRRLAARRWRRLDADARAAWIDRMLAEEDAAV